MFKKLLIPIDEFSLKDVNARKLRALIRKAGAQVVLVHVSNPTPPTLYRASGNGLSYISLSDHLKACEAHADHLFARFSHLLGRQSSVKTLHVYHSDVAVGIQEAAHKAKTDLILMASHRYPPVFGITSASDVNRVISTGSVPVIVC